MRITVTAADIHAGKAFQSTECPVALALSRATGRSWAIGQGDAVAMTGDPDRVEFVDAVRDFIAAFDRGEPVAPFEFDVKV